MKSKLWSILAPFCFSFCVPKNKTKIYEDFQKFRMQTTIIILVISQNFVNVALIACFLVLRNFLSAGIVFLRTIFFIASFLAFRKKLRVLNWVLFLQIVVRFLTRTVLPTITGEMESAFSEPFFMLTQEIITFIFILSSPLLMNNLAIFIFEATRDILAKSWYPELFPNGWSLWIYLPMLGLLILNSWLLDAKMWSTFSNSQLAHFEIESLKDFLEKNLQSSVAIISHPDTGKGNAKKNGKRKGNWTSAVWRSNWRTQNGES